MCYLLILYKLAEQILQTEKKIRVPSYYGIFKGKTVEFTDVKIDCRFERDDKQPDVIATTEDEQQYLIEFTFRSNVRHKTTIDYTNLTCLEVDLSNQRLETLQTFLHESDEDRKWLNNQYYFERIESTYRQHNKNVRVVDMAECSGCKLFYNDCCCVARKNLYERVPIIIQNSGREYLICKSDIYASKIKALEYRGCKSDVYAREIEAFLEDERRKDEMRRQSILKRQAEYAGVRKQREEEKTLAAASAPISPDERTCFMCASNLDWMCGADRTYAHCGSYRNFRVPPNTPPATAKTCKGFRPK